MIISKQPYLKKLCFFGLIAFFITSCKFTEPTIGNFNLQNFAPKSDSKYTIEVSVDVNNPNNYNIWLKKGKFDIIMGKEKVGTVKSIGVVSLKKNKKDTYTLKGEATIDPNSPLMAMILKGSGAGKKVTIKGSLKGGVFIVGKRFDVEFDDKIPSINMFGN
jgi:hypothetical protein